VAYDATDLEHARREQSAEMGEPSASEASWLRWADAVEALLGHDLDGDQTVDGYSIDFAYDEFRAGRSAADYVASVSA
jgi:hypothetical protein